MVFGVYVVWAICIDSFDVKTFWKFISKHNTLNIFVAEKIPSNSLIFFYIFLSPPWCELTVRMCRWVWHLSECCGYHLSLYTGDVCSNHNCLSWLIQFLMMSCGSIQVNVECLKIYHDLFVIVHVQYIIHNPSAILHYIVTCRPFSGKRVDKHV
jgi:hypothetical protein